MPMGLSKVVKVRRWDINVAVRVSRCRVEYMKRVSKCIDCWCKPPAFCTDRGGIDLDTILPILHTWESLQPKQCIEAHCADSTRWYSQDFYNKP